MPLRRLRSSLAVIPQDPVQVTSNVRKAIDPFGEFLDTQVLAIMCEVGLTHTEDDERGEPEPHREVGAGAQAGPRPASADRRHDTVSWSAGGNATLLGLGGLTAQLATLAT